MPAAHISIRSTIYVEVPILPTPPFSLLLFILPLPFLPALHILKEIWWFIYSGQVLRDWKSTCLDWSVHRRWIFTKMPFKSFQIMCGIQLFQNFCFSRIKLSWLACLVRIDLYEIRVEHKLYDGVSLCHSHCILRHLAQWLSHKQCSVGICWGNSCVM
jgi:hypothetical protein